MPTSATRNGVRITLVALLVGALPFVAPMVAGGDQVTDTRVEARRIADELHRLQVRESVLGEDFDQAQLALSEVRRRVAVDERLVVRTHAEVARHRNDLRRYAVGAYTTGHDESLQIVLHSEGNDLGRRLMYESVTAGNEADLIDALRTATSDQDAAVEQLRRAQDVAARARDDVDRKLNAVTSLVAKQQQILDRIHGRLKALVARAEAERAAAAAAAAHVAAVQAAANARASAPPAPGLSPAQPRRTVRRTNRRVVTARATSDQPPRSAPSTTALTVPPTAAPAPPTTPVAVAPPVTTPVAPVPTGPPPTTPPGPSAPPASGASVIQWAETRLGSPYVWGAAGPGAFDCSGLVLWSFAQAGRGSLPHSSRAMYAMSRHIPLSALQPGDLVFFGQPVHHVGIYIGAGTMIDALNSRTPVAFHSIYGISETPLAGRI